MLEGNARLSGTIHSHTAKTDSLIASAAAVVTGTNKIDLGAPIAGLGRKIGDGDGLEFLFTIITQVLQASTTGSITFALVTSANADLSSGDVLAQATYAEATMVAGFRFVIKVPRIAGMPMKRYLGYTATINAQDCTQGTVEVDLPFNVQTQ